MSKHPDIFILLLFLILLTTAVNPAMAAAERPGELPARLDDHGSANNGGWKVLSWGLSKDLVVTLAKERVDILGLLQYDSSADRFNHELALNRRVDRATRLYHKVQSNCLDVTSYITFSNHDPDEGYASFHFLDDKLIGVDVSIPKQVDFVKLLQNHLMVDYGGKIFRTTDGILYIANGENSSVYALPPKIADGKVAKKGMIEFRDPSVWQLEQACIKAKRSGLIENRVSFIIY